METQKLLESLYRELREIYALGCVHALLEWDQQVNLPPAGAASRAAQIEITETIRHVKSTSPEFLRIICELHDNLDSLSYADRVNVREVHRNAMRQQKLPAEFVGRKALASSMAFEAWVQARASQDFSAALPALQEVITLNRQEADLVGFEDTPYDALLDVYEPGVTLAMIKPVFLRLSSRLSDMLPAVQKQFEETPSVEGDFPEESQREFVVHIMNIMGFDFDQGRLDTSIHPFCSTTGTGDQRITTRYSRQNLFSALYGTMHETGHALYEMGLPEEYHGTPMGSAASLGVHESQSRFFENILGKSRQFCTFLHRELGTWFPEFQARTDPETLWQMINKVTPSLIRVEADEVTYSLHVIIRTLLEVQMLDGTLLLRDLPEAWDALYMQYLGIRPQTPGEGVLQDVHWYSGLVGYFPTYVLGNLYGAYMRECLTSDKPDHLQEVGQGNFRSVLEWLRRNVHEKGMQFRGPELVEKISGRPFSEEPFIDYLRKKFEIGANPPSSCG